MTYALYFELENPDDKAVIQAFFVPYCTLAENARIPPSMWFRKITPAYPARTWTLVRNTTYIHSTPVDGKSDEVIIGDDIQQLEGISSHLRALLSDESLAVRGSFPIMLMDSEKLAILENGESSRIPVDIITVIRSTRQMLGWPDLPVKSVNPTNTYMPGVF